MFILINVYACGHTCVPMHHMATVSMEARKESDPLKLKLLLVLSYQVVLGHEPRSSGKVASVLNI